MFKFLIKFRNRNCSFVLEIRFFITVTIMIVGKVNYSVIDSPIFYN